MDAPVLWVRSRCLFQLHWFLPSNRGCYHRHASTFVYALRLDNMLIYFFLQLLSQLTTRIRLYGGDCNQTALVVCFFLSFFLRVVP